MAQRQGAKYGEAEGELHTHLRSLQLRSEPINPIADALSGSADICPVCKSSRYLNPKLRFLINPECYHRMCESCIDRIFSQGPAPCPVAGCGKTLRKARFRKQTFEDIKVERECDVRREVSQVYVQDMSVIR
jgi:CDK-activating kinase assembly factor MAT1